MTTTANGLIQYRNNSTAFASYLRRGNVVKYTRFTDEDVKCMLPEIDAEFYVIDRNLTLFRGIDTRYNVFDKDIESIKEGDVITDKSYTSTTTSKEIAEKFSFNDAPLIIINFKAGQMGIDMTGIGDEYHDYQNEILLPRNSSFIVREITETCIVLDLI